MSTTSFSQKFTSFDRRLRRILMRSKKLNINQLDAFDKRLQDTKKSLATLVLEEEVITPQELLSLICLEADAPPIMLDKVSPSEDLFDKIDKEMAMKYKVFPISSVGSVISLAMMDPFDRGQIETIEHQINLKVRPFVSTVQSIEQAIDEKYPAGDFKAQKARLNQVRGLDFQKIIEESKKTDEDGVAKLDDEYDGPLEVEQGIIRLANKIIIDAYHQGVSDIHIEPGMGKEDTVIRFRTDGQCFIYETIPYDIKKSLVTRFKIMSNLDIAERRLPQDGKIQFKKYGRVDIELRVATVPTVGGNEDVVMRILASSKPMPLDAMGFSERNISEFKKIVKIPYGLILVVGPTGSGKTTTLHSAMGYINEPHRKIWTAEDPVEITQRGLRQVQMHPKIGFTFARAMRAFLRADPDVIMVGEMRDYETAAIGIEASLTGHLVLSTLHTNSAPETIVRLIDLELDPFNFADALLGIMAQRLTRRLCSSCKTEEPLSLEEYNSIGEEFDAELFSKHAPEYNEAMMIARPNGCPKCNKTGYKGRLAIHELLIASDDIKSLIQKKAKAEEIRDIAIEQGMTTLKQDGILKALQGHTDVHQIRAVCIK